MTELQRAVRAAGSITSLSRKTGVDKGTICNIAAGKRGISPAMCRRLGLPESLAGTGDRGRPVKPAGRRELVREHLAREARLGIGAKEVAGG